MRIIPFHRWHSEAPKPRTAARGTETPGRYCFLNLTTSLASGGKPDRLLWDRPYAPGTHAARESQRAEPGRAGQAVKAAQPPGSSGRAFRDGLRGGAACLQSGCSPHRQEGENRGVPHGFL